ncbi:MAG: DUF948 domain-containing protein [Actinobacteria bacterium]|nr:DUF948 domain-containing protein [Actinomycetota bacterium]
MALKVLQIICAVAVVVIVLLMIPVMLKLKRTLEEVGRMIVETRPGTMKAIKQAEATLDSVNEELENVEKVTSDASLLIGKMGEAADSLENTIKSPITKMGFISTGAAVTSIAVRKQLLKNKKKQ